LTNEISRERNSKAFFGKGIYPSQISFWLDFPLRRLILSPQKLADWETPGGQVLIFELFYGTDELLPEVK